MATFPATVRAALAAATPIGLTAQLLLGVSAPALAQSRFASPGLTQYSGAVLKARSSFDGQSAAKISAATLKIQPAALRQFSARLRSGQPVAASELDAYKEFCAEQASHTNVHETVRERSGKRQSAGSSYQNRSKTWDTAYNRDGIYNHSAKGDVGLFGGGGKVTSDITRNNRGSNRGSQADVNRVGNSGSSSYRDNRSSFADVSSESAQDCAAVLEHLTAKEQSKTDLAKATIEAASKDREIAANERIRMAELAAQKELAQMQAQLVQQQGQADQAQGWMQLGMGLLGNLMQPRQQAAAPQPDLAQLQQLILEQQAQIKALQQQQAGQ